MSKAKDWFNSDHTNWGRVKRESMVTQIGTVNGAGYYGAKITVSGAKYSWRYTVSVSGCTAKGYGHRTRKQAQKAAESVAIALLDVLLTMKTMSVFDLD